VNREIISAWICAATVKSHAQRTQSSQVQVGCTKHLPCKFRPRSELNRVARGDYISTTETKTYLPQDQLTLVDNIEICPVILVTTGDVLDVISVDRLELLRVGDARDVGGSLFRQRPIDNLDASFWPCQLSWTYLLMPHKVVTSNDGTNLLGFSDDLSIQNGKGTGCSASVTRMQTISAVTHGIHTRKGVDVFRGMNRLPLALVLSGQGSVELRLQHANVGAAWVRPIEVETVGGGTDVSASLLSETVEPGRLLVLGRRSNGQGGKDREEDSMGEHCERIKVLVERLCSEDVKL